MHPSRNLTGLAAGLFVFLSVQAFGTAAHAQAPPAPTLSVSASPQGSVTLTWNAVIPATDYAIFRTPGGFIADVHSVGGQTTYSWQDGNANNNNIPPAQNGTTYQYYVIANSNSGSSPPSNTVSITPFLAAPRVSLIVNGDTYVLHWNSDPGVATGRAVFRTDNGGSPVFLANVSSIYTDYSDPGVYPGHTYTYYVIPSNYAGAGLTSNTVSNTTNAGAPGLDACPVGDCSKPYAAPPMASHAGSKGPDPVSVATGIESNNPGPDLAVYNPVGPAAIFQRTWRGNQAKRGYGSPGLPVGWVHNYDYVIEAPASITSWSQPFNLISPNGATETITPVVNGSGLPTGAFTTSGGAPYLVNGVASGTTGKWNTITIILPDRSKWEFSPHTGRNYALTKIYNRMGQSITLVYSGYTRALFAVKRTDTGANLLSLYYGAGVGGITKITDTYNRQVNYTTALSALSFMTLQKVSQVATTSGPFPDRWVYGYQSVLGNSFLSQTTVPSPTGTGTSTATINYDPVSGKVASIVDANGYQTLFTYGSGQTTITDEDAVGNVVLSYTQKYDSQGRNTGIRDALGNETTVEYNDFSNPNKPTRILDALSRQSLITYDIYGNVVTVTDPRGTVTTFTYDYGVFALGRLISVQEGSKPATTIAYNEPSGLVASVTGPALYGSGVSTVTASFTYDSLGNVLTTTAPGNNAATTIITTFNYTADGTGYTQAAALGQPLRVADNLGHASRFRYDTLGRATNGWDALNNESRFTYNLIGQTLTASVPATGQTGTGRGYVQNAYLYMGGPQTSAKVYDETGVLVRTTNFTYGLEGEPLSVTGATEPFAKTYDAAYRVISLSDGNGQATTYSYDVAGRLSGMIYPGGDAVSFPEYFADGQLKKRIDGNGTVTTYAYTDPAGALTNVTYPATPGRNVSLTYDSTYGRLTSRTDATGLQTYAYGDLDEVTGVTTTYTFLPARTMGYTYYPNGSRKGLTTPAGNFTYTYDAAGRPTGLTNPFGEASSWAYGNNDWLSSQTMANGHTAVYTYNALGQLTNLLNKVGASTTLSQFNGITHDGAGNRLSVTASVASAPTLSGSVSYGYDSKDQVTGETRTGGSAFSATFGYDGAGNPTTFKGLSRTYNVKNQLTGGSGLGTFTYDGNGNPTTYNGSTVAYDPENHATSFGTALTADYTAAGLRAWKQDSLGNRTYYLYDGVTPVVEMDMSGNAKAVNTFGANGLVSRRTVATGTSVFYAFDERGNTNLRLDASGNVLSSRIFDSFGVGLGTPTSTGDPFDGFGAQYGYYSDAETGLILCMFRYYDPQLGRWLTRDPIGYAGGINLYGFVTNNPIMGADPTGHQVIPFVDTKSIEQFAKDADSDHRANMAAGDAVTQVAIGLVDIAAHNMSADTGGEEDSTGGRPRYGVGSHGWADSEIGIVPEGVSITMPKPGLSVPVGEGSVGWEIAGCHPQPPLTKSLTTFISGQRYPNLLLMSGSDMVGQYPQGTIMGNGRLSSLIEATGPGDYFVSACTYGSPAGKYPQRGRLWSSGIYSVEMNPATGRFDKLAEHGGYGYEW